MINDNIKRAQNYAILPLQARTFFSHFSLVEFLFGIAESKGARPAGE